MVNILDICNDLDEQVEMALTDQKDSQIRVGIWLCARVVATRSHNTAQYWAEDYFGGAWASDSQLVSW